MSLELRRAGAQDLNALVQLEASTFATDRLSRARFAHHLNSPRADLLVAVNGIGPVGYGLMLYRRGSTISRLYSLAVAPGSQGQGLATQLVNALRAAARERKVRQVHLEVAESNAAARHLYTGLGGRVVHRLPGYYENGEDAVRMVLPV